MKKGQTWVARQVRKISKGGGATPLKPPPGSASARTYFGFTFDEFACKTKIIFRIT